MNYVIFFIIGISLSSACGFRVFVPPLVLSIAAKFELITIPEDYSWVGSNFAIIILAVATVSEILTYYIPVVDNFMDLISTPASFVAGTLVMILFVGVDNNIAKWLIAALSGGTVAVSINAGTSIVRLGFTSFFAGLGNWIVSSLEWLIATILSFLAIFLPIVALILIIFFILTMYCNIKKIRRKIKNAGNE